MTPKRFLFFLFLPIMVPLALFVNATYDWWVKLSRKRVLFFLLLPIYGPLSLFLYYAFDPWAKLAE
jgi:hypothetical protein